MARPRLDIDEKQVYELAKMGASNVDIAQVVGCTEGVIRQRFSDAVRLARANRRNDLHAWQWKAAEAGSEKMLIWLGKQYLGQADKIETKNESKTTVVIAEKQRRMLQSERALDLACDLEREIFEPSSNGHAAAGGDDPGGLRALGQ